ncbi:MAG TPA: PEP/pyruvate-binding domain-containing protein, partial [Pyrinomonadaceae bacterium]|nr:PEP/pyruvate-binding domain-containing protein [Pyrinomonadaceae bacterium]
PLDSLTSADAALAGGKAYNCSRLKKSGFPVPDGFVLFAGARACPVEAAELEEALRRLPEVTLFAVRSSATDEDGAIHSFAGIHETKLNVTRDCLAQAIEACRASVESEQALAYRRTQGLRTDGLQTGVLVQAMIRPVASGVAFTINPLTGARDELVISATWGLGEALVGGHVEPDEFRLRKRDASLLSSHIGDKLYRVESEQGVSRLLETDERERRAPSLSEEQLRELAGLLLRIEQYYDAPQDVEWCYDGARFWIVQSRPVTAAALETAARRRKDQEIEWTRANAREVLPDLPSPQVLSALCDILNRGMRRYYGNLAASEAELGPMMKSFYGRPYFNLSQFRHVCRMTGSAPAAMMRALGHEGEIRPEDEVAKLPPLRDLLRALPEMLRLGWMQLTVARLVRLALSDVKKDMAFIGSLDPRAMANEEILGFLQRWDEMAPERLGVVFVLAGAAIYETSLQKICDQVGFPYERLLHPHLAAGEKSVSAQQGLDLLGLANRARREERARAYFLGSAAGFQDFREGLQGTEFLKEFELFLDRYGHRGNYESDWSLPRYSEDPTPLLFAIRSHVQAPEGATPETIIARQEREAQEAWRAFEAKLNWRERLYLPRIVRWLLRRTKRMYVWRELCRSELMRPPSAIRFWLLVMGERLVERGLIDERDDYFYLTREEISASVDDAGMAARLRSIVASRKAEIETWRHLEMPLLMRESELPSLMRRAALPLLAGDGTELRGLCVSAGCIEGEVLVMRDASEFARMKRGAILVAPATDPSWTPLFTLASGVIVEVGGTLSHASTVAREYGLPALANLKDATKLLKDGDRVRLDATNGVVRLLGSDGAGPVESNTRDEDA